MSGAWRAMAILGVTLLIGASAADLARAESESPPFERGARLREALDAYSMALAEPERDARLAGFARAERGFASLVEEGVRTPSLYTNLGNAALQAQAPGRAVLAYHRALSLDPDASSARQNLIHVRSRLPAWVPRPESTRGLRGLFDERRLPAPLRARLGALSFFLGGLCALLAVWRKEGAWRGLGMFFGLVWVLLMASFALGGSMGDAPLAVLTGDEVLARSADSALAPLALPEPLPAGVEVDLLEQRAEWSRVRLANGREIWVRSSSVTAVSG